MTGTVVRVILCGLAFIGLMSPSAGNAHLITFDFTGTFVAADPHSFGGINSPSSIPGVIPNSIIAGSFSFDADIADSNGSATIGQYNGAIEAVSFLVTHTGSVLGGQPPYQFGFNAAGSLNSIQVNSNPTAVNQSYIVSANVQNVVPNGPIVDGSNYLAREFYISLVKPSSSVFSTDALPETPPSSSLFSLYDLVNNPNGQFRIVFDGHGEDHTLIGNLNSLTLAAVPIPAAAYLFGTGIVGLVTLARRRPPTTS